MGRRNGHGRKPKDSCVVVLLVGASLTAGLSYLVSESVRWLA
jgi:hypothetical protein